MEPRYKLEWSTKAQGDLGRIRRYCIRHFSEKVANKAIFSIVGSVNSLAVNPNLGTIDEDFGLADRPIRVFVSTKNKIYYSISGTVLLVHRVWDTRQDPRKFKI